MNNLKLNGLFIIIDKAGKPYSRIFTTIGDAKTTLNTIDPSGKEYLIHDVFINNQYH